MFVFVDLFMLPSSNESKSWVQPLDTTNTDDVHEETELWQTKDLRYEL